MPDSNPSEALKRFLHRLALLNYGRSPLLDAALTELKNAIKEDQSLDAMEALLVNAEQAADEAERHEKKARWQLNAQVLELAQSMDLDELKALELESNDASTSKQLQIVTAALKLAAKNSPDNPPDLMRGRIQDLLNCMRAYGRETVRCQELLEQLDQDHASWQPVLDEAIAMAIQLLRAEQAEFEQYLATLNDQLAEIRQVVSSTQTQDAEFNAMENRFSARLDEHFQRIEDHLAQDLGIEELKTEIVSNLQGIRADMGEFLAEQRLIRQALRDQMINLGQTVSSMAEENRRQQRELVATKKSALTDALTGMPNRTAYEETWPNYVANANEDGLILVLSLIHI